MSDARRYAVWPDRRSRSRSEDCWGTLQARKTEKTCVTLSTSSLSGNSEVAGAILYYHLDVE